jgi:acetyl esterase/lipase
MTHVTNVLFGRSGDRILELDLVVPDRDLEGLRPALLWLHGGGWYSGDRANAIRNGQLDPFVDAGFLVASADYRLAGEAIFPAQIHDVKAAIRFLRANANEYGIDPRRVAIAGFSAGAHLAALAALTGDLPELEGTSGNPGYSTSVSAALVLAAPTDFLANPRATDPALNPHLAEGHPCAEHLLLGGPVLEKVELARTANPVRYATAGAPPILIVHGREDETVPVSQAGLLYEALIRAGAATVTLLLISDGNHGFWKAGHPYPREPVPPRIKRLLVEFLMQHVCGIGMADITGRVEEQAESPT